MTGAKSGPTPLRVTAADLERLAHTFRDARDTEIIDAMWRKSRPIDQAEVAALGD